MMSSAKYVHLPTVRYSNLSVSSGLQTTNLAIAIADRSRVGCAHQVTAVVK